MTTRYLSVALPVRARKTFTYSLRQDPAAIIAEGSRVLVPFGRKLLTGIVVDAQAGQPDPRIEVREVREVLDSRPIIPSDLLRTALWAADYYFTPPGEIFRALMPAGIEVSGSPVIGLNEHTMRLLSGGLRPSGIGVQEDKLLEVLFRQGPMTSAQLARCSGMRKVNKWLAALIAAKWVSAEMRLEKPRAAIKKSLAIRPLIVDAATLAQLTPHQRDLYNRLRECPAPVLLSSFLRQEGASQSGARSLARKGCAEIVSLAIERTPQDLTQVVGRTRHRLTDAQQQAADGLRALMLQECPRRALLHGVTGSGKTEIYLRLISEALTLGGSALLLVPEIGLTPLLSRLVLAHFPDQVSLLHSGMSAGERLDQWQRIREGRARVVVGTRSAVFAPLAGLRLIIIDEEQDPSYKQEESPCYHAREIAWHRMQQAKGLLLMGSATPSFETYHSAAEGGLTARFWLGERIEARPLPQVTIVDMAQDFQQKGKKSVVSEALRLELIEQLRRGEQSIVLLNRRGYARTLMCRNCGHVFSCPDCSISMTYHRSTARMICHYCGREKPTPSKCVNCEREYIYFMGAGTEQLEEIVHALVPEARLARVDRDTTRRRGAMRKVLNDFAERKLDVLIGTQMLAKGHDFPHVTLVGVIAGDAGLSFPDFRAAERTFQLLTQVAGRSGRGTRPGRVLIQAFCPDHYALRFAQQQDYAAFFKHEQEYRKNLGYPPFRALTQIVVSDSDPSRADRIAGNVASALRLFNQRLGLERRIQILGPALAPIEKLRGQHRLQILMKSIPGNPVSDLLSQAFAYLAEHKVPQQNVHVDVDPLSLM